MSDEPEDIYTVFPPADALGELFNAEADRLDVIMNKILFAASEGKNKTDVNKKLIYGLTEFLISKGYKLEESESDIVYIYWS